MKFKTAIPKYKKLKKIKAIGSTTLSGKANSLKLKLEKNGINTDSRNGLEKALNLPQNQNWFFDGLDLLDRITDKPAMAIVDAVVKDTTERVKSKKAKGESSGAAIAKTLLENVAPLSNVVQGARILTKKDTLNEVAQSVMGNRQDSNNANSVFNSLGKLANEGGKEDLFKKVVGEEGSTQRKWTNLAGDLTSGIINPLSIPVMGALGKAAKGTLKGSKNLGKVALNAAEKVDALKPIVKGGKLIATDVGKKLNIVKGALDTKSKRFLASMRGSKDSVRLKAYADLESVAKNISARAKHIGVKPEVLRKEVDDVMTAVFNKDKLSMSEILNTGVKLSKGDDIRVFVNKLTPDMQKAIDNLNNVLGKTADDGGAVFADSHIIMKKADAKGLLDIYEDTSSVKQFAADMVKTGLSADDLNLAAETLKKLKKGRTLDPKTIAKFTPEQQAAIAFFQSSPEYLKYSKLIDNPNMLNNMLDLTSEYGVDIGKNFNSQDLTDAQKLLSTGSPLPLGASDGLKKAYKVLQNNPDALKHAQRIVDVRKNMLTDVGKAFDVNTKSIDKYGEGFRHLQLSDYGKDFIRTSTSPTANKFKSIGSADIITDRAYTIFPPEVVNNYAKMSLKKSENIFEVDPIKNAHAMVEGLTNQSANTKILSNLLNNDIGIRYLDKKTFGKDLAEIQKANPFDHVLKQGEVNDLVGKLKSFKGFDPDITEQLITKISAKGEIPIIDKAVYNIINKQINVADELHPFLNFYDKLLGGWKSHKLVSIGYHARNMIGAATNAILAGVPAKKYIAAYGDAFKDANNYRKILQSKAAGNIISKAEQALLDEFDEFVKTGLYGSGKAGDEVGHIFRLDDTLMKDPTKVNAFKKFLQGNAYLGQLNDDAARFALWRILGDDPQIYAKAGFERAEDFIRFSQFDYKDMSEFEVNVMRRAVPFYTFMRKNLEFQMTNALKNPLKYKQMGEILTAFNEGFAVGDQDLENYAQDRGYLPIPTFGKDGKAIMLKIGLPTLDAFNMIGDVMTGDLSSLGSNMTPLLRTPLELGVFKKDAFTGQELSGLGDVADKVSSDVFGQFKTTFWDDAVMKKNIPVLSSVMQTPTTDKIKTGAVAGEYNRLQDLYSANKGDIRKTLKKIKPTKKRPLY